MDIRDFFFRNRGYIPIPLAIIILIFASIKIELLPIGVILVVTGELLRLNGVRYALRRPRSVGMGRARLMPKDSCRQIRDTTFGQRKRE